MHFIETIGLTLSYPYEKYTLFGLEATASRRFPFSDFIISLPLLIANDYLALFIYYLCIIPVFFEILITILQY